MHLRRRVALVLGLTLAMLNVGVVAASDESSNGGMVFSCDGGVCTNLISGAAWSVTQGHSEGQHYWVVRNLRISAVLSGARSALNIAGVDPMQGIKVEALNAAGTVVRTITMTQGSYCGFASAISASSVQYTACRSYVELPLTVTRLRFVVKIEDPAVFGIGWSRTWTAPIQ